MDRPSALSAILPLLFPNRDRPRALKFLRGNIGSVVRNERHATFGNYNHYQDDDSYANSNEDIARGVRLPCQLFYRNHFVEGDFAIPAVRIGERKAVS